MSYDEAAFQTLTNCTQFTGFIFKYRFVPFKLGCTARGLHSNAQHGGRWPACPAGKHLYVVQAPSIMSIQIDELVNIGASANMEQGDPTANRLLKLALTDGHQAAFAYEYDRLHMNSPFLIPLISDINLFQRCRSRILGLDARYMNACCVGFSLTLVSQIVIRNIIVRRGMMQLTPDTCFVLGGAVPLLRDLQAARDQQVARREAAATQARAATAAAASSAAPVATTTTTDGIRSTGAVDTVSRVPSAPQSAATAAAAAGGRGSGRTAGAGASGTRVIPNHDPTRRRPGNNTTGADDGSTPHSAGTEAQVHALFSSQQSDDSIAVVSPPRHSSAHSGSAHRQGATDVDGGSEYGELDPDDVLRATMQLERRQTHPTPTAGTARRRSAASAGQLGSDAGAGVIDLVNTSTEHVDSMEIDDDDLLEIDTTPVLPAGQRAGGSTGNRAGGRGMDVSLVWYVGDWSGGCTGCGV